MCETHLSSIGSRRFIHALRCQKSRWQYVIPGAPCPLRARSEEVGSFTGVAGLSTWPTRALAHSLHDGWYQSSRVQVLGAFIQQMWINIAVVYGYPYSKTHHAPRYQTEQLLEGAINRIACQTSGPRVIMGDFNWEPHELTQLQRLEDMGFKELQTIAWEWWGIPIRPTGKGDRRIDCVYVSPELFPALRRVVVDDVQWTDHSAVYGVFQGWKPVVERFHWKMPMQADWPKQFDPVEYPDLPNQTIAYASFWDSLEKSASRSQQAQQGKPWQNGQFGRGQTLETIPTTRFQHAPIRKSRADEEVPAYFGNSIRYAQQFKQVRRLQSLVAQGVKHTTRGGDVGLLWNAIRNAPGFVGGFCAWWQREGFPKHGGPRQLSVTVPPHEECLGLFQAVKFEVQAFAKQLSQQRYHHAKELRAKNLRYVYKDCAREPPRKVDVLVETVTADVVEVSQQHAVVEVDQPVPFQNHLPVVNHGKPLRIISQEGKQVQLEPNSAVEVGDTLRQSTVIAEIPAIFEAFRQEWEPRWVRHSRVCDSQWDQINQFAKHHLRPIPWHFPEWTEDRFVQVVRSKKSTAATGPDGISRQESAVV